MNVEGRPGILLDRDGTLIDVVRDEETGTTSVAFHPSQLRLLPGVLEGLSALAAAGFVLAIASNQPGPAKGQISRRAVERTNLALLELLADAGISISALEVCLHHPVGGAGGEPALRVECDCRKPKPGLLLALISGLGLSAARSWMIGDSLADLQAANAAQVRAALVFSPERCELCPLRGGPAGHPDLVAPRFDQVAGLILAAEAQGRRV